MKKSALTLKIFLLIVVNDIGESIAQLFMKKGLTQTGIHSVGLDNVREFILQNASSWLVWLGIIIYTLNFLIWIVILSRVELSVASPVGSTGYVIIPLAAALFLNERIGLLRGSGIALIALGVHLVSKSTQPAPEIL